MWSVTPPDADRTLDNVNGESYMQPVGFLAGIQQTLQLAAADYSTDSAIDRFRYPYVHNGRVFFLELRNHEIDDGRAREYSAAGLVTAGATVHKLTYRVVDDRGDEVASFELWTELPALQLRADQTCPIMPVAFEFTPRSYLKLKAVRTMSSAPPPASTPQ